MLILSLVVFMQSAIILLLSAALLFLRKRGHRHKPAVGGLAFLVAGVRVTKMQIVDDKPLNLTLVETDKFDNPVAQLAFDAPPTWVMNDPSYGDLVVAADGLSAAFNSNGKLTVAEGDAKVQVSAVVGGQPFAGELPLMIVPGAAAKLSIKGVQ